MVWRGLSRAATLAVVVLFVSQSIAMSAPEGAATSGSPADGADTARLLATLYSHGPDPVPDEADDEWPSLLDGAAGPVCATDPVTDYYARVILMDPLPGIPGQVSPQMVANLAIAADAMLANEAARFGRNVHLKVLCDLNGAIDVAVVPVSVDAPTLDFWALVGQLAAQGHTLPNVHYWVFYDGYVSGIGGQGTAPLEHEPVLDGGGNTGPHYAITYGYQSPRIMLHELTHNMGAVSWKTPNTSSGAHCNDGLDVMCYRDGGSTSWYRGNVCTGYRVYDCNHDDYFHPDPGPDNYLWDHWNIASGLNRFAVHEGACAWVDDLLLEPGNASSNDEGVNAFTIPLNEDCADAFFTIDNDPAVRLVRHRIHRVSYCFESQGVDIACEAALLMATGTIPAEADSVRIWVEGDHGGGFRFMPN